MPWCRPLVSWRFRSASCRGRPAGSSTRMLREDAVGAVYWNRRYDLAGRMIDAQIESALRGSNVEERHSFNARSAGRAVGSPDCAGHALCRVHAILERAAQKSHSEPGLRACCSARLARLAPIRKKATWALQLRNGRTSSRPSGKWVNRRRGSGSYRSSKQSGGTRRCAISPPAQQPRGSRRICASGDRTAPGLARSHVACASLSGQPCRDHEISVRTCLARLQLPSAHRDGTSHSLPDAAAFRGHAVASGRCGLRGLVQGQNRLSDHRCGNA